MCENILISESRSESTPVSWLIDCDEPVKSLGVELLLLFVERSQQWWLSHLFRMGAYLGREMRRRSQYPLKGRRLPGGLWKVSRSGGPGGGGLGEGGLDIPGPTAVLDSAEEGDLTNFRSFCVASPLLIERWMELMYFSWLVWTLRHACVCWTGWFLGSGSGGDTTVGAAAGQQSDNVDYCEPRD